jgi:hypothetical protein
MESVGRALAEMLGGRGAAGMTPASDPDELERAVDGAAVAFPPRLLDVQRQFAQHPLAGRLLADFQRADALVDRGLDLTSATAARSVMVACACSAMACLGVPRPLFADDRHAGISAVMYSAAHAGVARRNAAAGWATTS